MNTFSEPLSNQDLVLDIPNRFNDIRAVEVFQYNEHVCTSWAGPDDSVRGGGS